MGVLNDCVVVQVYDIGLQLIWNEVGEIGFEVFVGGGFGCILMIGCKVCDFLLEEDFLVYFEVILCVYNCYGWCDNKYKVWIKILVYEIGFEDLKVDIEVEFECICFGVLCLLDEEVWWIEVYFVLLLFEVCNVFFEVVEVCWEQDVVFVQFVVYNFNLYWVLGYIFVMFFMKLIGGILGDVLDYQMDVIVDFVEQFGYDEIWIFYEQNVILLYVKLDDFLVFFDCFVVVEIVEGNVGLIIDIIVCLGMDYCVLVIVWLILVVQWILECFGIVD